MLLVGLALGVLLGWLVARRSAGATTGQAQELRAQLELARQEAEKLRAQALAAEKAQSAAEARVDALEEARRRLTESFNALAAEALRQNNQSFLTLAEQKFASLRQATEGDLEARRQAIQQLVEPMSAALSAFQQEARALEQQRVKELSAVGEQLRTLQQETSKLAGALSKPQVRGRWGEIALRRTAELAGMTAYCDFVEQESVNTQEGRLRPDMIVHLPAGRDIVVDSKVPWEAFRDALSADSEEARNQALDRHAAQLRAHFNALSAKRYWEQFENAPEFVVLFIPHDSFLAAAAEREPGLIEEALEKRVVIATPTTFVGLLRAIEYGWRQERVAESARKVSDLGRSLHERLVTFLAHLEDVGGGLARALDAYNRAVGSLQSRLLPLAEKFEELGAASPKELRDLQQITERPRVAAQRALPGVEDEAPRRSKAAGSEP